MHPTLNDTLTLVKHAHGQANDLSESSQTPYYWHLLRVMLRIKNQDENVLHIALLHDTVEDTDITLEKLKHLGYNERIIEGVRWCSNNMFKELTFGQWMEKFGQEAPQEAVIVKFADISDNLGYERMHGLMVKRPKNSNISKKIKTHQYPLIDRIDKKVTKKMRLHGDMGVFTRYYKAWNLICAKPSNIDLIQHVDTEDFCKFNQLKQLAQYLPQEEMLGYLKVNKLHTWTIEGKMTIHRSGKNQDNEYLAIDIPEDVGQIYQSMLSYHIENDYIQLQKNRDNNHFHITFLDSGRYGSLKKHQPEVLKKLLEGIENKTFDFWTYGIGTAFKKESQAWFSVTENAFLNNLRSALKLPPQDFHMTLAFKNSDVFGVPKNRTTSIISNEDIWTHWVENNFYPVQKLKNKII